MLLPGDAGAVCGVGAHAAAVRACGGRAIITRHAGEMARLLDTDRGTIEAYPRAAALRAADRGPAR